MDFRELDFSILRELLYPQSWSSNVTNPPGSSRYCYASSSGLINSYFKFCFVNLGVFSDVTSKIFER